VRGPVVLVPLLLVALGACGGSLSRDSGPDASNPRLPGDDTTDGDAGSPGLDSGLPGAAGNDATAPPLDSGGVPGATADASAFSSCSGARDVFYVAIGGPGAAGEYLPFPSNPVVVTNLDATWSGTAIPLGASATTIGSGGGSISIATPDNGPVAPGTYAQPLTLATPRPYLRLVVGDTDLTADGSGPGSFTVAEADVTTDDAGTALQSFLVTFDFQVPASAGMETVTGCMRYTADPTPVPGPAQPLGTGAALMAPCTGGGYAFYADFEGDYPGLAGVTHVDSDSATFNAGAIGSFLELNVQAGASHWQLQESADIYGNASLQPGTYALAADGQGEGPSVQVIPPVTGCVTAPTGTFGVVDVASSEYDVSRLATWFDLQCAGQGSLRGCAVYGE
jgi:hypothetical protein